MGGRGVWLPSLCARTASSAWDARRGGVVADVCEVVDGGSGGAALLVLLSLEAPLPLPLLLLLLLFLFLPPTRRPKRLSKLSRLR